MALFKLKKADASTELASFEKQPNWRDLVSKISLIFDIPPDNVTVSHVDKDKETTTLHRGHAPELSKTLCIPYGPGKVAVLPRETVSVDLYPTIYCWSTPLQKTLHTINTLRNA